MNQQAANLYFNHVCHAARLFSRRHVFSMREKHPAARVGKNTKRLPLFIIPQTGFLSLL